MSNLQTLSYLAGAAVTAGGSAPTVAPMYENREALVAALDTQAVLMDFANPGNSARPIRALLSCGINGSDGQTAIEDIYLVTPVATSPDATPASVGLMCEPIGSLTWTAGASSLLGGRTGEKIPKNVSASGTGRLAGRTGIEIAVADALPAMATIYDVGPGRFLLRVPRVGDATGVSLMGANWR